jgi:hypothetical protein
MQAALGLSLLDTSPVPTLTILRLFRDVARLEWMCEK